ncbi:hypothetical protein M422DRAFT_197390 [Sphaerobolus stellatus SS14]|uniref:ATP phosphoribosyltransferase n=1 Tax=Sphaerobolus stellatus (strain SS14) TaxID=990650 RepID=A0A0C9T0L0_SPHS4|nr:hypothetical protein M422DRAFT_197390 [Sphaerobolus stellatus SS14]
MPTFKLVFFSPVASTQQILRHLFASAPDNVGKIGLYRACAFVGRGTGQFLPLEGANPNIGEVGKPEFVEENRVEVIVNDQEDKVQIRRAIEELKKVHPYEEPAYEVYKLEDL